MVYPFPSQCSHRERRFSVFTKRHPLCAGLEKKNNGKGRFSKSLRNVTYWTILETIHPAIRLPKMMCLTIGHSKEAFLLLSFLKRRIQRHSSSCRHSGDL